MASQSPPTADAPAPQETPAPPAAKADQGGVFEYVGTQQRTYLPAGQPPQTAVLGDVCQLGFTPTDGNWIPSRKKPTRLPDNHPDQMEIASDAQAEARITAHLQAAKADARRLADLAGEGDA